MLCSACQSAFEGEKFFQGMRGHHRTIADLEKAALESCYICDRFWHQWRSIRVEDRPVHGKVDASLDIEDPLSYFSQQTQHPNTQGSNDLRLRMHVNGALVIEFVASRLQNERRGSSFLEDNTGSVTSLLFARDWIDNCADYHVKCKNYLSCASRGSPTRLVEIGQPKPDMVRLWLREDHEGTPAEANVPYFTLSHCWGSSRFLTLSSSTFQRLQEGISVAELPRTFQDAVYVAEQLGGNFIWIDSLCILQDSQEDWQKESVTMASIYGGSRCNIAAAVAVDGDAGFIRYRDPTSCLLYSAWTNHANGQYSVGMVEYVFWDHFVEQSPLLSRGWVRQECLLAPRVLYFTRQEIFWTCHEFNASESHLEGFDSSVVILGREAVYDAVTSSSGPLASRPRRLAMEFWKQMIARYTRCYLTHPGDKLIALAGVAQILGKVLPDDRYVAGLWKNSLVNQLVWYVMDRPARKAAKYRAPSWSWACVDNGVAFSQFSGTSIAKVLDVNTDSIANEEFGQVMGGHLRLSGPLMTLDIEKTFHEKRYFANGEWMDKGSDLFEMEATPQHIHFLPLLNLDINFGSDSVSPGLSGLLLEPTNVEKGQFRRVGIMELSVGKIGSWKGYNRVKNQEWFEFADVVSDGCYTISII